MRMLIVDDEELSVKNLENKINRLMPEAQITSMTSPVDALDWVSGNDVDLVFLDISMGEMNGIDAAKMIKIIKPQCIIVFVTGYSEYAVQAFSVKANGYLVKPVDNKELQRELNYARDVLRTGEHKLRSGGKNRIYIQCFGNFSVFVDNLPMRFSRTKSKEILAYLIDRKGASVSFAELASVIWDDGQYDLARNRQMHTFLYDLIKDFKRAGIDEEIIIKSRNSISVNTNAVDCDYYDYLVGEISAINAYIGEYMVQYSWAEATVGELTKFE